MTVLGIWSSVLVGTNAVFYFLSQDMNTSDIIIVSLSYMTCYLVLCIVSSIVAYHIDKSKRLQFLLVQKVQVEIQKTKSVLNYLLPAFVRKRVKNGVRFISENQGEVSIIFCDICEFEDILKTHNPEEFTMLLDEIYGKFDHICMLTGCTKIETVGKTYMACAGLKEPESELDQYYRRISHARRTVEMAVAIIRSFESFVLKTGKTLKFKIGINSGQVTAGVVGYHKPQFSLVGDTVNTASRMASLCPKSNIIQITKTTFQMIGSTIGLNFSPHNIIAKGKGRMDTYLVSCPAPLDNSSLGMKHGITISQSVSELFSSKSLANRSKSMSKKLSLYKFSNQHADNERKRSTLISMLECEVSIDHDFIRRHTQTIEKVKFFSLSCNETSKEKKFKLETSETTYPIALTSSILGIFCNFILLIINTVHLFINLNPNTVYEEIRIMAETFVIGIICINFNKYFRKLWFS